MASYTMLLKAYIEQASQYENLSTSEKIERGRLKLFDFDYPIFDENYKKVFETNFIRKFYHSEIGFETEGMFKFHLETWLNINMPYFNKMFESEMLKYDPLINSEMNVTHNLKKDKDQLDNRNIDQTAGVTAKTGSKTNDISHDYLNQFDRNIRSDNPDSRLRLTTGDMGTGVIEYASGIDEKKRQTADKHTAQTITNVDSKSDSDMQQADNLQSNINEIEDFIQHRQGKIGVMTYSDMVMKYRKSFLRIENMIHGEVRKLFMLVY